MTVTHDIEKTIRQYDEVVAKAEDLFIKKFKDYGPSWTILRLSAMTDQIWIKAARIRSIQEAGKQLVGDSIESEFLGILNYCIIALILMDKPSSLMTLTEGEALYQAKAKLVKDLMVKKNHDYGEAWRDIRISSMVDLSLAKLLRIKQIEDNKGKVSISEGVDAGYQDIANYAIFCLIRISEGESPMR